MSNHKHRRKVSKPAYIAGATWRDVLDNKPVTVDEAKRQRYARCKGCGKINAVNRETCKKCGMSKWE